jgi:hypothetical protein
MNRARARVARAMMTAMRVVGEKEGKDGKATRVAGEQTATSIKSVMTMKTREAGEKEGIGRGGKSNGNGEEDGNGKQ